MENFPWAQLLSYSNTLMKRTETMPPTNLTECIQWLEELPEGQPEGPAYYAFQRHEEIESAPDRRTGSFRDFVATRCADFLRSHLQGEAINAPAPLPNQIPGEMVKGEYMFGYKSATPAESIYPGTMENCKAIGCTASSENWAEGEPRSVLGPAGESRDIAKEYIAWLYQGKPVQPWVTCIHGIVLDADCEKCAAPVPEISPAPTPQEPPTTPTQAWGATESERRASLALLRAGNLMGNLCYNGAQSDAIPEGYRKSMSQCVAEWDQARDAYRRVEPKTPAPGAAPTTEKGGEG